MWHNYRSCGQGSPFLFDNLILFVIKGAANFVLSEAELKGASDSPPRPHILTPHGLLIPTCLSIKSYPHIGYLKKISRYGVR